MSVPKEFRKNLKAPELVAKQPNGAVPDVLLDTVESNRTHRIFKMAALPAAGMRAMHAAIFADLGVKLSTTGRGRTLEEQWRIFAGSQARYQPCTPDQFATLSKIPERTKVFPAAGRQQVAEILGVTVPNSEHWTKIEIKPGIFPATAAVPGTSPHGLWCADDLAIEIGGKTDNVTGPVVQWLFAHEHEFGFGHGPASEPWHVQWAVGDFVPPRVVPFLNPNITVDPNLLALLDEQERIRKLEEEARRREEEERKRKELDMARALKVKDNPAIFLVNGAIASWVADPEDYNKLVFAGFAPPLEQAEEVDRSFFGALRLVGAVPPGFEPADFEDVIDGPPIV